MSIETADLRASTPTELLDAYVAWIREAQRLAERRHSPESIDARENAEAIAAEIERRCVR